MNRPLIIAEIGKNYVINEKPDSLEFMMNVAKKLVLRAKECGADVAKFQWHEKDEIHPMATISSPHFNHDRYEWIQRNVMPDEWWFELREHCRINEIEFLATPMCKSAAESMDYVVGVERWKVGSADILDFPMLDYIRDSGKPVILSSGMSSFEELKKAYDYVNMGQPITIMHCVSLYPCPVEKLNLATIPFLKKQFPKAEIGFSDHSLGIEGALMAAYLGVSIIEKHFTLDRGHWGPDHKCSLLFNELKEMCEKLKSGEYVKPEIDIGVETKLLQNEEVPFRTSFRKGLYAAHSILKGEGIGRQHIIAMRPKLPDALPSEDYEKLLLTRAKKDYEQYEIL